MIALSIHFISIHQFIISFLSFNVVEFANFVLAHASYEGAEAEGGENAC